MNLSQELLVLESIARLALSDLSATATTHDLSRQFHESLTETLAEYVQAIADQKRRALAHDR
jgi:hypothetical protein